MVIFTGNTRYQVPGQARPAGKPGKFRKWWDQIPDHGVHMNVCVHTYVYIYILHECTFDMYILYYIIAGTTCVPCTTIK